MNFVQLNESCALGHDSAGYIQQGEPDHLRGKSVNGEQVYDELEIIMAASGLPNQINVDNGPEYRFLIIRAGLLPVGAAHIL